MNPLAVHDRTIARSTEAGRRAFLLELTLTYRAATRNSRRIMLQRALNRAAGIRNDPSWVERTLTERDRRDLTLRAIEARDPALADLLRAEHEYLIAGLAITRRPRPHNDAGRIRHRRAITAWFRPEVQCLGCATRIYEVAEGVWLAYERNTARCPASRVAPHLAPADAPRGRFPHPKPTPDAARCSRCNDHLTQDEDGWWISRSTELSVCWSATEGSAPLHFPF